MKIELAQLNYHIGNFEDNLTKIAFEIKKAQERETDLLVFSELAICGYPPHDLLENPDFVEGCIKSIAKLARVCDNIAVLIGGPAINPRSEGKRLYNSAYFIYEKEVRQVFHKSLLPTYDIFDEYRYFEPNREFRILNFKDKKIGVTICEDLWSDQPTAYPFGRSRLYTISPMEELKKFEPDLVVNLSASPFAHSRTRAREHIFKENARKFEVPVFMVNQMGAQTDLIFDGGSMVINKKGEILKRFPFFKEHTEQFDTAELDQTPGHASEELPGRMQMIHDALVLGIKDYFAKLGFREAVLGLSGGIDSSVTLVLATRALGAKNMHVLLLPSQYSSESSLTDAAALAKNLGVRYEVIDIRDIFESFNEALDPLFTGTPEDITEENIQSRIRGTLLMAFSNKFGHILLNTSNKSEAAVGYGTLYGDMAGGLSVLGDVYKTDVFELARWINRDESIIPENVITKPPSAELKPGQLDSDSLPDYDVLDRILNFYIEQQLPEREIIRQGFDKDLVHEIILKVNHNEYKRYQTPPILRVSTKAFGVGRRMPLVAHYS